MSSDMNFWEQASLPNICYIPPCYFKFSSWVQSDCHDVRNPIICSPSFIERLGHIPAAVSTLLMSSDLCTLPRTKSHKSTRNYQNGWIYSCYFRGGSHNL